MIMRKNNPKQPCDLRCCMMCRLCLPEWLPAVQANRRNFKYKKGENIFKAGDAVRGIYFVYKGSVKIHKNWGEEKELIIRFAREGDIFGHRGFGTDTLYPITATALEPLEVCYIDQEFFYATLRTNTELLFKLMLFYAQELQESEKNMRNLAHMPVKGRLAGALLKLKEKFGVNEEGFIAIRLSRQDIAAYAGTTYETVFRLMTTFAQEDLVSVSGKAIRIINDEKLMQLTMEKS